VLKDWLLSRRANEDRVPWDFALVKGSGYGPDRDCALGPDSPQCRKQSPRVLVRCRRLDRSADAPCLRDLPSLMPIALRIASAALVRSEISRRSFFAKAA
jgi:hypothetical protein